MNISFIFYKLITYLLYVGFLNSQLISTNSSKSSNLQNSYNHTKSSLNSLFSSNQSSLNDDKNLRLERAIIPLPMFKWPRTIHYAVRPPVPAALVDRVLQNLSKKRVLFSFGRDKF
ncbi:Hypothetical protein SRAE_X000009500 [Strongyloides ratti]|uniref:Uncharacterized protein n=1 Tax=Strongyloides ratti TaxID=34506 RepID=A0A090LT47_STRRB|nr:Hypothetical protein SRAE_X000009500 [Strongyloides ratti]CEF70764.1 Hypothetical protein SRAE_X000009500 [Strongyloides ratti]